MNHRISCSETLLRLDDFVDRALSPDDLELVEEHLLECVKCAEKFRFETSLVRSLRERLARIAVPEALLRRIRERLADVATPEGGPAAHYGAAPPGYEFLVIGHESFGRVEAVGPNVTELRPGDYVVATVRRPGSSIYDRIGTYDITTDDVYFERGINLRHGFLTEYYVEDPEYLVNVPAGLREVGVLLER